MSDCGASSCFLRSYALDSSITVSALKSRPKVNRHDTSPRQYVEKQAQTRCLKMPPSLYKTQGRGIVLKFIHFHHLYRSTSFTFIHVGILTSITSRPHISLYTLIFPFSITYSFHPPLTKPLRCLENHPSANASCFAHRHATWLHLRQMDLIQLELPHVLQFPTMQESSLTKPWRSSNS